MFKSFDSILEDLRQAYNREHNENTELRDRLREYSKDAEIQKLNDTIKRLHNNALVMLSDKEKERLAEFRKKHYEMHNNGSKVVGSTYQYELSGTGIGTVIKIKCPICGEIEDVTDTDNW